MRELILCVAILVASVNIATSQTQSEIIIGNWERIEKKLNENSGFQILMGGNDSPKKEMETLICFKKDKIAHINQGVKNASERNCYAGKYSFTDNDLIIGTRSYRIIKLDKDSLIIRENKDWLPEAFKYFRTTKLVKEVLENETIETKYPNGNIKEKGTFHYGFMHGKWEEFYESGQIKSEKHFSNAFPTGIWKEWDEDGNLIKEEKIGL